MSRYHVKADGSMGVCTAKEGHCPFGGEEGTRHFTNKVEAQKYSEERIKAVNSGKSMGDFFRKKKSTGSEKPNGVTVVNQFSGMEMPSMRMVDYKIDTPFGDAVINRVETDPSGNCYVIMSPSKNGENQIPASLASMMNSVMNNENDEPFEDGGRWYDHPYFDNEVLMVDDSTGNAYKIDQFSEKGLSASGESVGKMDELVNDSVLNYRLPVIVTMVDKNQPGFGGAANKPDHEVLPINDYVDGWNPIPMVENNLREFGVEGTVSLHPGHSLDLDSPDYIQIDLPDGKVKIAYDEENPLDPEKVIQKVRRSYLQRDPDELTESEKSSVDLMGKALRNSNSYEGVDWGLDNQRDLDRLNELFQKNGLHEGYFDRNDPEFYWMANEAAKTGRSRVEELVIKSWGDSYTEPTCLRFGNDWPEVEKLTRKLHISLPDEIYAD